MPYLDSKVFIYPVIYQTEEQTKAKKAKEMLLNIEKGKLSAYTSILTWDEVVWVISRAIGREEAINQGRKLLGFPNLKFVVTDTNVLSRAQRLIERNNISPRDALHVASALEKQITEIVSDDADFDKIKEITRITLE